MAHEKYQELLNTLHDCMVQCNHCYDACLEEDDVKMMAPCIRLDRECADICGYLAQAITRGTPYVAELASVCAKICEDCGNECKKHEQEHCQKCADICMKCADACRKVA
ncbi:four-helix bundle copper-binding protein [Sediminibacillus dalangtanensis]|uniref:Four-helix bundle copper-binding protein n=1 Tax=Sediminibacillus dalangtanensis TaxID=2729421 RepID=A0ABX7VPF1_9BACI|nr:four-helix bundle copper-binding protein [Sediminibacillus dalangtanensis]QTM98766.1 four-helix bundle copper-binding protein [Sediminibacillus dalangtanensis]